VEVEIIPSKTSDYKTPPIPNKEELPAEKQQIQRTPSGKFERKSTTNIDNPPVVREDKKWQRSNTNASLIPTGKGTKPIKKPPTKSSSTTKVKAFTVPITEGIGNQRTLRKENKSEVLRKGKQEEETERKTEPKLNAGVQTDSEASVTMSPPLPRNCEDIGKTLPLYKNDDVNKIIKQGFLVKRGHMLKNWKVRWFTLTRIALSYSKKPETIGTPLGQIDLAHAPQSIYVIQVNDPSSTSTKARQHVLKIVDKSTGKDFFFDAKTQAELQDWVKTLNQTIADNISNISFRFYQEKM